MNTTSQPELSLSTAVALHRVLTEYSKLHMSGYAICGYVTARLPLMSYEARAWVASQFMLWPEFSGNSVFPVPHPMWSPQVAFLSVCPHLSYTEYGQARRRLTLFLITRLEELADEFTIS